MNTPTVAIVRVLQDWNGRKEAGQLSIVAGELIHVKKKNPDGNWEGVSMSGNFGSFPSNLTEEVANLGNVTRARAFTLPQTRNEPVPPIPIVKAMSPKPLEKSEKSEKSSGLFSKIKRGKSKKTVTEPTSNNDASNLSSNYTYSSSYENFSNNYQQQEESNTSSQEIVYAKALRDFESRQNKSHLSFSAGEYLRVRERYPTGWWKGEIVGNQARNGLFPSKEVQVVDQSEVSIQDYEDLDNVPDCVPQMARYGSGPTSPTPVSHSASTINYNPNSHSNSQYGNNSQGYYGEEQAQEYVTATMQYPFYAENDGELTVEAGEKVWIMEENEGWTYVQNNEGNYGLVPAEYVQKEQTKKVELPQLPKTAFLKPTSPLLGQNQKAPSSPVPSRRPPQLALNFRAVFKYEGRNSSELSFQKGDTIVVTEQTGKNWWKGKLAGKEGRFPATYVRELDDKTSTEEQLDRAHAKFTKMQTTYEDKIKKMEAELEQLRMGGNRPRAFTSQ